VNYVRLSPTETIQIGSRRCQIGVQHLNRGDPKNRYLQQSTLTLSFATCSQLPKLSVGRHSLPPTPAPPPRKPPPASSRSTALSRTGLHVGPPPTVRFFRWQRRQGCCWARPEANDVDVVADLGSVRGARQKG
jgi:hypothetical protein